MRADNGAPIESARWSWYRARDEDDATAHHRASGTALEAHLDPELVGTLVVRIEAPGFAPVHCRFPRGEGRSVALGELALRAGVRVRGRLRTRAGAPVAAAGIRLIRISPSRRTAAGIERVPEEALTRADGTFDVAHLVAPGAYRVVAVDAPPLTKQVQIELAPDEGEHVVDLVCRAVAKEDQIRGVVQPAPGQQLTPDEFEDVTVTLRSGKRTQRAWCRRDGSFVFHRRAHLPRGPVQLTVSRHGGGDHHTPITTKWGADDLRLVLEPGNEVALQVTAGGAPVTDFAVRAFPLTGATARDDRDVRAEVRDAEDGRVTLRDLRTGPHLFVVHPRGEYVDEFTTPLPVRVEVTRTGEQTIELPPRATLQVVVRGSGAQPIQGSRVELLALRGIDALQPETRVADLSRYKHAIRVATAVTDESGVAQLPFYASEMPLSVRVTGDHIAWHRDGVVFDKPGQQLVAEVQRGARLAVALAPKALLQHLHRFSTAERTRVRLLEQSDQDAARAFRMRRASGLVLERADGVRSPRHPRRRHLLDDAGRVSIRGIPPGTWRLFLEKRNARGHFEELPFPLATVELGSGGDESIVCSLRDLIEPATLRGEVRLDGRALARTEVQLRWLRRDGVLCSAARVQTDATGRFTVSGLPGRTYRVVARVGRHETPIGAPVVLAAGADRAEVFTAQTVTVRLQLMSKPYPRVVGLRGPHGYRFPRRPNAKGEVVFERLPVGRYTIPGATAEAIDVQPTPAVQRFERRL